MKGVILAGGLGTRLRPLTLVTNKHLLPVYDRPMIYYPIQCLLNAGIRDILIVTGGEHAGDFLKLLKNGKQLGIRHLEYAYQEGEGGIAEALDLASVDAISIEDAHRPVDLGLLDLFERSTVILGLIAIAKTRVESIEEIRQRLDEALSHIDPERLVAAPDCGLGMLDLVTAKSKLANLTAAANSFD